MGDRHIGGSGKFLPRRAALSFRAPRSLPAWLLLRQAGAAIFAAALRLLRRQSFRAIVLDVEVSHELVHRPSLSLNEDHSVVSLPPGRKVLPMCPVRSVTYVSGRSHTIGVFPY